VVSPWFSRRPDGVRIAVRLTPGAARDEVDGIAADAAGDERLMVRVTVPPEKGRANSALKKLLAKRWRLPASRLSVVGGATARSKLLDIAGDADTLLDTVRSHEENGAGRTRR
jgi:uncharacterized protein (TIGR00251 family)